MNWTTDTDSPEFTEDQLKELPKEYRESLGDNLHTRSVAEGIDPDKISEFVSNVRQSLTALNGKLGLVETSTEKRGNVHPYRISVHQKGGSAFIARTNEQRPGGGGSDVSLSDLGF